MTQIPLPPDAIQWHEGMLLSPHHFQQSALRQEMLLAYHLRAVSPNHWGVRRLRIDAAMLLDGTFRITELEAVMPDGLLITLEAGERSPLEVDLKAFEAELKQGPVTIQLAIAAQREGDGSARGELARFDSVEGTPVADLNTGEGAIAIPRLRPRAVLLVTETPPDKYIAFPIAGVMLQDESYAQTNFIPPALTVTPTSEIGTLCARLARRVREKAVYLGEKVRANSATVKRPMVLETQFLVQALSAGLPPLEAALRAGASHPYDVYLMLTALAGQVAACGTSLVPPVFEEYRHNDLRATYNQIVTYVGRILDGIHEAYRAVPLQYEGGNFSVALLREWVGASLVVGVIRQTGMSDADVIAWMDEALIGSRSKMDSIRDRRIRGPARQKIEAVEELGLVPKRGELLFAIRPEGEFIEPEEILQLSHPGERVGQPRPAEIVLYARTEL